MLTALIIEDEKKNRDLLHTMLTDYCDGVLVVGKSGQVQESLDLIRAYKPQLVFMDIQLPGKNGFELLDTLPERSFEVIFTTAYEKYALQAIKYSGIDYLLKPISLDELKGALKKAEEKIQSPISKLGTGESPGDSVSSERLVVPTFKGFMVLESYKIMYLEAEGSYTRFFFEDGSSILICEAIGQCEGRLSTSRFVRIHRSRLVNLWHIQEYIRGRGGYILLKDGKHLNVSARRKAGLIEALRR